MDGKGGGCKNISENSSDHNGILFGNNPGF